MKKLNLPITEPGRQTLGGVPEGYDAAIIAEIARATPRGLIHIARDDARMTRLVEALAFFAPELSVITFPAWDCLPYDRVSPNATIVARRVASLARLTQGRTGTDPIVVTTVAAILQRIPPKDIIAAANFSTRVGQTIDLSKLQSFLEKNGYRRTGIVREPGEYALRGGIVDLFPAGEEDPLRLDLFGETLERIRLFDPLSQRSGDERQEIRLLPVSELFLNEESIHKFREGYRGLFGAILKEDPLYEAISAGQRHIGMEHWLPLFYGGQLATLFDYLPQASVSFDYQGEEALVARMDLVHEHYNARRILWEGKASEGSGYKPLPPIMLYPEKDEVDGWWRVRPLFSLTPFDGAAEVNAEGKVGRNFADARSRPDLSLFDSVIAYIQNEQESGRRTLIAAYSAGSRDRLASLIRDHGLSNMQQVETWRDLEALPAKTVGTAVLGIEHGFIAPDLTVISEEDIFGDRLIASVRRKKRADRIIAEAGSLTEGDLVVHEDHGIGRYNGLETLTVGGAAHDCLQLLYAGGDRLYVPVENIDTLSRFGSEDSGAQLDKLGHSGWQARKAKVKERIREIAGELLKIAAERQLQSADRLSAEEGLYAEFCARFPFHETDDQQRAIDDVTTDLFAGRPMDRLVCGDVGFGKTEVALRAAFIAALSGKQVAVVVPTTLLARQHYKGFCDRFSGFPVRIAQLSRLITGKVAANVKQELSDGSIDIVIGTHALLAKSISFKNLGLVIVDEEQHFGVSQKERLKQLRAEVHVLTLTATPIPRTLQLALTGIRELSIIATPPVDRLAVRTFVMPYDSVVLREAIMREHFRGGQSFYVCPRIEDIEGLREKLKALVPELKIAVAHGQMSVTQLESTIGAFYDGKFNILLSTNIVESGLDIPTANTMIIHRADMFGLAQLYQLRGRIGRSKVRAYAYLLLPEGKPLTEAAQKRLEVMQTLDNLGAGFQLASHDLDIRGAGNLLGDEQSGHIREVGIELYQQMLEEAVTFAKAGITKIEAQDSSWTPQISLGTAVLIPEVYVQDLDVRLGLYRRIAELVDRTEIEAFAAELIDRFGPLPDEVENLLETIAIKKLCREAGVEKLDAGPKGAVITFRHNRFANPHGLVTLISRKAGLIKVRPDQKLVYMREFPSPRSRLKGVQELLSTLTELAVKAA
ncbi:MAG: transcription-repair coupling factor [Alphaproteobacteria bacterium]